MPDPVFIGQAPATQSFPAPNLVGDGSVSLNSDAEIVTLGPGQWNKRYVTFQGSAPLGFVFPATPGMLWFVRNLAPVQAKIATQYGFILMDPGGAHALLFINDAGLPELYIPPTTIADGSITTAKLANGSVTGAKLENTGVTPGTYTNATITLDAEGRAISASSGGASTSWELPADTWGLAGTFNALRFGITSGAFEIDSANKGVVFGSGNPPATGAIRIPNVSRDVIRLQSTARGEVRGLYWDAANTTQYYGDTTGGIRFTAIHDEMVFYTGSLYGVASLRMSIGVNGVTLPGLAGGGTRNIAVDNTGLIIPGTAAATWTDVDYAANTGGTLTANALTRVRVRNPSGAATVTLAASGYSNDAEIEIDYESDSSNTGALTVSAAGTGQSIGGSAANGSIKVEPGSSVRLVLDNAASPANWIVTSTGYKDGIEFVFGGTGGSLTQCRKAIVRIVDPTGAATIVLDDATNHAHLDEIQIFYESDANSTGLATISTGAKIGNGTAGSGATIAPGGFMRLVLHKVTPSPGTASNWMRG